MPGAPDRVKVQWFASIEMDKYNTEDLYSWGGLYLTQRHLQY